MPSLSSSRRRWTRPPTESDCGLKDERLEDLGWIELDAHGLELPAPLA
jgi:hypothetical protein